MTLFLRSEVVFRMDAYRNGLPSLSNRRRKFHENPELMCDLLETASMVQVRADIHRPSAIALILLR